MLLYKKLLLMTFGTSLVIGSELELMPQEVVGAYFDVVTQHFRGID